MSLQISPSTYESGVRHHIETEFCSRTTELNYLMLSSIPDPYLERAMKS